MLNLIATLFFHFLLTTTVLTYSESSIYQPTKSKSEHLFMNPRSGADPERSTRRVFSQTPIRFGGRSDIPPLVGKVMEYEAMLDDDMERERRAFMKNNNHMRFGRANSNFIRFGRSRNDKNENGGNVRLTRANNSLFLRFGRGNSDFLRFGRSGQYLRNKRDASLEEKRGNNNFLRFGKRYNEEEYAEDIPEDDTEQNVDYKLQDALLFKLLTQIACKMDNDDCERLD